MFASPGFLIVKGIGCIEVVCNNFSCCKQYC